MKKFCALLMTLMALSILSCEEKEIIPIEPPHVETDDGDKDTDAEGLVELANTLKVIAFKYKITGVADNGSAYIITYGGPGMDSQTIEVPKDKIKAVSVDGSNVRITLINGAEVNMVLLDWLSFELSDTFVSFDRDGHDSSVRYTIDSSREEYRVTVTGGKGYVRATVLDDEDGKGGTITFTPLVADPFVTDDIVVSATNGAETVDIPFIAMRKAFRFDDGSLTKSFDFPEYGRYVELPLAEWNKDAEVSVPEECGDWLSARMRNYKLDGRDMTSVEIFMEDNRGNAVRQGCVTISVKGNDDRLTVTVNQSGAEMEGSFTSALKAFYDAMDGPNWYLNALNKSLGKSLNWFSDDSMADWFSLEPAGGKVESDISGRKRSYYSGTDDLWALTFDNNGVKGAIPDAFWEQSYRFKVISICHSYLDDTRISEKVWHENLEKLEFVRTYVGGELTPAIARAKNLKELSIDRSMLSGTIPEEVTTLRKLEVLSLCNGRLSGHIPQNIGNLKELREFGISGNLDMDGGVPDGIYGLDKLEGLYLGYCKIGGKVSPRLAELKNLKNLDISFGEFEGIIPEEIGMARGMSFFYEGNYIEKLPEFERYTGYYNTGKKKPVWFVTGSKLPYTSMSVYQRKKGTGRPDDLLSYVTRRDVFAEEKYTECAVIHCNYDSMQKFPLPMWARLRYGITSWTSFFTEELKRPDYPSAEDLQYPVDEYYYDGKDWRHPKLQYPAREYYRDSKGNWVHDASCPWDKPYVYQD